MAEPRQELWQNDAMPAHHPASVPDFLYGTAWKEDRTQALTELALRMGFRGIDTANQRRHYFEAGVGQGLAAAYRAGVVTRADLFLQTKFTYQRGQDHRLPYDPAADLSTQVAQSMASSLEHLGTDHVDSYVLHGPGLRLRLDRRRRRGLGRDGEGARRRPHAAARREQRLPAAPRADGGRRRRDPRVRPEPLLRPRRLGPRGASVLPRAQDRLPGLLAAHRQPGGAAPPAGRRHRRARARPRRPRWCSASRRRSACCR